MSSPSFTLPIASMPVQAVAGGLPDAAAEAGASFGQMFEAQLALIGEAGTAPRTAADLLLATLGETGQDASASDALLSLMTALLGQTAAKVSAVGTAQDEMATTDILAASATTSDPLALAALVHTALAGGAAQGQRAPLADARTTVAVVDIDAVAGRAIVAPAVAAPPEAVLAAGAGRSAGHFVAQRSDADLAAGLAGSAQPAKAALTGSVGAGEGRGQEGLAGEGPWPLVGKLSLPASAGTAAATEFSAVLQSAAQRVGAEAVPVAGEGGMTVEAIVPQVSGGGQAASSHAAVPVENRLQAQVGTTAWKEEFGQKIVWLAQRQEGRAELVLTPPHMGRIEINLQVNQDQASALFTSANPAVREALEAALPRLREMLAEAGIQLGQTQVGAEGQYSQQAHENRDNRPDSGASSRDDAQPVRASMVDVTAGGRIQRGLVDTFA